MSVSSLENECAICFEDLEKYDIAILNCDHKFHYNCIKKWINKSNKFNKVCPLCNIEGEIINIEKKDMSKPNSPVPTYQESEAEQFNQINQNNILSINTYTQNDNYLNTQVNYTPFTRHPYSNINNINNTNRTNRNTIVVGIDQNNQLRFQNQDQYPYYRPRRTREQREIENETLICCNIL